jgi:hypothetical protein
MTPARDAPNGRNMSAEQTVTNGKATIAERLDDTSGVEARLLRSRLIALNRRPGLSKGVRRV